MPRPLRRRPSLPTLIALLALFVALGGPAEARRLIDGRDIKRGTVRGKQIKDRSLGSQELSHKAARWLRQTPTGAIDASKLATGAVTAPKLAPASVTAPKLAPASVTGGTVADQSLGAADLAPTSVGSDKIAENAVGQAAIRANGVAASEIADDSIDGGEVVDGGLKAADVTTLSGSVRVTFGPIGGGGCVSAPVRGPANVDIADDLIAVSPADGWPRARLTYGAEPGPERNAFSIVACNPSTEALALDGPVTFRYGVFDL